MDVQTLLYPGKYHPLYCEDHVLHRYLDKGWFIGAVMDGCSSGKDSHFASALYMKSIQKACNKIAMIKKNQTTTNLHSDRHEAIGARILHDLFEDVQRTHRDLSLDVIEMLSTLLLLVYRIDDRSAWINVSGDGLIINNGERIEIDQQNMPDYLAYHIDMDVAEWLGNRTRTFAFHNVRDLTISTDGVLKLYPDPLEKSMVKDPISFLLGKNTGEIGRDVLHQRLMKLIHRHHCIPYDDIGLIRVLP